MQSLDTATARRLRAGAQGIGGGVRAASAAAALDRAFAVQAQDQSAAALGLRVRAAGLTAADVVRALETDRSIVRGWFMRGTLYLVPAADLRWLTGLLGPVFLKLSARRYRELGLDAAALARAEQAVTSALAAEGPLTRTELAERLAGAGLDPSGQVPFHVLRRCALLGRICHGPTRDKEPCFVLLDDWLPAGRTLDQADAATELARRYLSAHGPAALEDFATWSGLPVTVARGAWRALVEGGEAVEYEVAGQPCLLPADRPPVAAPGEPDVRLLPAYDNYLVGYRTRALSVAASDERQVWPGGGQIRATVTADGLACATWSRKTGGRTVAVAAFHELSPEVRAGIAAEEADVMRFLGSNT
ncbi:winged helix DNA-binding domain-containing protein [Kitasatospora acidiphila]|uniref:winged helix DNA-binding domain-containing protein n=1 Tax=Kitasatospora acidiphila TaxID=2567942 RepID=UPI003C73A59B